ncbi:MAG: hypothetical protein L6R38_001303 [Xanthoria sp. 2 TBL-2021]|nr:MAG: hypothetical protein L6R38_001303 [Xanthoria sp. 2 TBL-2021]
MSLVDTKSMESVGVRERSVGAYDVHGVPAAIPAINRFDFEEHARTSSESGSDLPLQKSVSASESSAEGRSVNGAKETPLKPLPSKPSRPSDVKAAHEQAQKTSETNLSHLQDEEATNVEKWRQDVETPDETQARIDAVIAANELAPEDPKPASKDENPRTDRAKAGLIPGKKVYCSHWIRSGDCDFVQQGCLYKHEMPDDDTLRAIGIRALPSWYIAAHPEKARKRGWGSSNRASGPFSRSSTWKPSTAPFPAPSSGSFRMPLQAHLPSFQPPGRFGHSAKVGPSFLRSQASYPHTVTHAPITSRVDQQFGFPRVQELSDHQYQQWQDGALDRPSGLQIVQKPPRSPGYKTFPFPVPGPMPTPGPRTSHTEPKPLWPPRQSKFTKVSEEGNMEPSQKQDGVGTSGPEPAIKVEDEAAKHSFSGLSTHNDQSQRSNVQVATGSAALSRDVDHVIIPKASTSLPTAKNNGFVALKPSTVPEPVLPKLSTRERQSNGPSNPFDQTPTEPQQPPRQMFSRTARQAQVSGSRNLERNTQTRSVTRKEPEELLRNEAVTFKEHCQIRADQIFCRKDVTEDNKKKLSCSPEGKPKAKRAVKKRAPSTERLLDFEN